MFGKFYIHLLYTPVPLLMYMYVYFFSMILYVMYTSLFNEVRSTYQSLLYACLLDGIVDPLERAALTAYRLDHHIDDDFHIQALQSHNWTIEEFNHGKKIEKKEFSEDQLVHALKDIVARANKSIQIKNEEMK